ncbi:hypothetical protein XYCOK13_39440 [Xylanibacillus composti]|uniref:Colicin E3-like ribonuclease domain-containing protein n=1 Tax=Xylanibacillus composti TaxID=1572762 RepID=A0A8J4M4G8_9BACL|nr:hypothetical protein XYCOK13_39440 [Xylanibacillus composti]
MQLKLDTGLYQSPMDMAGDLARLLAYQDGYYGELDEKKHDLYFARASWKLHEAEAAAFEAGQADIAKLAAGMYGATKYLNGRLKLDLQLFASDKKRVFNVLKQESPVWKTFDNVKGKDRRTTGHGRSKQFYEWDHTHNDIEVYNSKGKHLGSMDPITGQIYKGPVKGRTIDID